MTLSERLRSWARIAGIHGATKMGIEMEDLAAELEGKVAVTPITLSQVEGTWSTELPRVHGVGGSPEESRARFDEALKNVK